MAFSPILKTIALAACLWLSAMPSAQAVTYTFTGSGNWTDPARWSPSVPPSVLLPGDIILIATNSVCTLDGLVQTVVLNSNMIVETNAQLTITNSFISGLDVSGLLLNSGVIHINRLLSFTSFGSLSNNGTLNLNSGGSLNLAATNQTMPGGTFNWNGGVLSYAGTGTFTIGTALTIPTDHSLTVTNSGLLKLDAPVTNQGNITIANNSRMQVNATMINAGNINLFNKSEANFFTTTTNQGSITVNTGTSATTNANFTNASTGTLNIFSNFDIVAAFTNNGTISLGNSAAVFIGGTVDQFGTVTNSGSPTVIFLVQNSIWREHTANSLENLQMLLNSQLLFLGSEGNLPVGNKVNFNSGSIGTANNTVLKTSQNYSFGSSIAITIPSGATLQIDHSGSCGQAIQNAGTIQINQQLSGPVNNTGILNIAPSGIFNPDNLPNSGTINIQGVLNRSNPFLTNTGTINILSGGKLHHKTVPSPFPSGTVNWSSGGTVSAESGSVIVVNESLVIPAGGTLLLTGGATLANNQSILNQGMIDYTGGTVVNLGLLRTEVNLSGTGGTFNNENGSEYRIAGANVGLPPGTFNWKSGSKVSVSSTFNPSTNIAVPSGRTFEVLSSGTINTTSAFSFSVQGTAINDGTWNHNSGTLTSIGNFQNNGTLHNQGTISRLSGSFSNAGLYSGVGSFLGFFTNATTGTISPGNSPGCISFGNSIGTSGKVLMEISGTTACTQHDRLGIIESATLGGTLEVQFINGFTPQVGQSFVVLVADVISGTFGSLVLPPGITGSLSYLPNEVRLQITGALPVELLHFQAKKIENNTVNLNWSTASEKNNAGFDVQRSTDGADWNKIGYVNGQGESRTVQHYKWTDEKPLQGRNYYRLLQWDRDGKTTLSAIVQVVLDLDVAIGIYPNPSSGSFTVEIPKSGLSLQIFDLQGKVMYQQALEDQEILNLSTTDWPAGQYRLLIHSAAGVVGAWVQVR